MKVKRIYKYSTGEFIPEGAVYLTSLAQTNQLVQREYSTMNEPCWLVWHYFLVEVEEDSQ